MKPINSALPVANWIMRISVFLFLLLRYIEQIKVVNFQKLDSVLIFIYVLAGLLLLIGGFIITDTLTIISGAILFLLTLYFLIDHFPPVVNIHTITRFVVYLWPASIGLYFASSGNG